MRPAARIVLGILILAVIAAAGIAVPAPSAAQQHGPGSSGAKAIVLPDVRSSGWVTRDHRRQPRGRWNWAIPRELPQLYREFNGVDFGHAHLAETLLKTQDPPRVDKARLEILNFIFSSPPVPPDEEQVAPTFIRMVWEAQKAFNWAHTFHRSLYDLFAADNDPDKASGYQKLLADYLNTRTKLIAEQTRRKGESNIVGAEVRFRHQLTPRFVLDAGIGTEFAGPTDRSTFFFTTGLSFGF